MPIRATLVACCALAASVGANRTRARAKAPRCITQLLLFRPADRPRAQAEGRMAIGAGDLNERPKKSAPDSLGTVSCSHRDAQLGSLGVHETVRVELGRPESKPRRTGFGLLLFSHNTTVSRATPVCQQLRELGVFSELGQRRPQPSGVPEEPLE